MTVRQPEFRVKARVPREGPEFGERVARLWRL
jgi:hypothetical protein